MNTSEVVEKITAAIQEAPEKAQELIADPSGAISSIVGDTEGVDIHEVINGVMSKAGELGLDFSNVDLSKLDLSQIDVTKLDLGALKDSAEKLGVDVSKLDLGSVAGDLLGKLGGIFGK